MAYSGRLAIVAGGLGGLGSSTAKLLHSNGARVALLYAPFEASKREDTLKATFGSTSPANVTTHECDITSEPSVSSTFASIVQSMKENGGGTTATVFPSMLINAAGYVSVQPLQETSVEEATKNIVPNLIGPLICSKAFFDLYTTASAALRDSGSGSVSENSSSSSSASSSSTVPGGRIVSISSQAAHVALDGHGPYCASKAGLNALTRSMAVEWGPYGITANTVSPTVVLTSLGKKAWEDPEKREKMLTQIPTGRFAEPSEIATAIEFLCREENGMINGADLRVDGGFTIR